MADVKLEAARLQYAGARAKSDSARTALIRANEMVKRLEREVERLARRAEAQGAGNDLAAAQQQLAQAKTNAGLLRDELVQLDGAKAAALSAFAEFTNPADAVAHMPDDAPIALFPLRLETRYRTVGGKRFFCVRAYPDDVLVDTFQPEIAETELANVTNYWVHRWRAAGDPAGHRAAWAALARGSGAGRAKWLIDHVAPTNPADEPNPGPHVLVITPASPVPAAEKGAIAAFWARIWATAGAEHDAAFDDLVNAVGASRAAEIESTLVPVNLLDTAVPPDPAITPRVAFLDLPPAATLPIAKDAWTRGARAWLLPERLVLVGFRNGQVVLQRTGLPIPSDLQVGPDPSANKDEQIKASGADLEIPEPLQWMTDFDKAVAAGMAFAVALDDQGPLPKFDRLFVLGIRVGSTAAEGAAELSQLIANHQASRKGFSILPQGSATNNTDAASAGYTWWEDPDESFRHFFESDPDDDPSAWERRKDGAWLAGMLGVDRQVLQASPNYYGTDQAEARAMNVALWPATLGYYMEQMLEPVFSEGTVRDTREFFTRFVIGRGPVPLIRVGRQPYGVLPATVWSRMAWWKGTDYDEKARVGDLPGSRHLNDLYDLTKRATVLWDALSRDVANAAEPGPDPQQTLLSIVALHPTSAEFYQRYARTFTNYYNLLQFSSAPLSGVSKAIKQYIEKGLLALKSFGWTADGGELPEILEKIFLKKANLLKGPLVQAALSDETPLAVTRADGLNYIAWLKTAVETSHDALRRQDGFGSGVPEALLYQMLRHALDLGFIDAALAFRRKDLQLTESAYRAERKEPKSMYIGAQQRGSRWEPLYRAEPAVTKDPALLLGEYIPKALATRHPYLASQLSALDVLQNATSGALERAFVEHLDCLTYRLDAWRMGLQGVQLSLMRGESPQGFAKGGVYIGAYGWLENVAPKEQTLAPKDLDGELAPIFEAPDAPPLVTDSANFGHIHAPSLDHAVTAAILRNGHLANATPEEPDLLAIDLSSERVRLAQQIIEGMRNGQPLGALLGYRLERALHDEPDLFLDRLVYDLRQRFPLAGNRNLKTQVAAIDSITKFEARNVIDGEAFVDYLDDHGVATYPYGLALPPLADFTDTTPRSADEIGTIIDQHVAAMRSVADAVADLQIAEGVYQVVRGNYERASGTLDAFSKGTHPPLPEVVTTPRKGRTLTHRVALHLPGGLLPADPANVTPRAQAEPALAQWLSGQLPDPATIFARVTWSDASGGVDGSLTPSMQQLGLAAVDLFYMLDAGGDRDMPGFDALLIDFAENNGAPPPRHDARFTLEYKPDGVAGLTLFEVAPLVRAARGAVLGARPLRPTDLALSEEAAPGEDTGLIVRADKAQAAVAGLQATAAAIAPFLAAIEAAAGDAVDPAVARDAARDHIDAWMAQYAAIVRPVVPFGLEAASLTAGVEGRRTPFEVMRKTLAEIIDRWQQKAADFDAVMALLPAAADDDARTDLLIRAARIVSTSIPDPSPAFLQTIVAGLRGIFDNRLAHLITLRNDAATAGALLIAFTAFLPEYESIDQTPLDLGPFRDSVLALARDLRQKAAFLRDDVERRVKDANAALTRAMTATGDKQQAAVADAAHAILGDSFLVLPELRLSPGRLAEWNNAWTNRAALLAHLAPARPFPIDDWRIGVARVRERMRHLELMTLLGEALGSASTPALDAVQFPFRANDAWLGLEFPELDADGKPFAVKEDHLLYTAHFGPGAAIDPANANLTYSGLLLDEWVEVVPVDQVTSGLAFHFDRPNSEAPQAILLVTPPATHGAWQWKDIVDTLHETLDFARIRAVEPAQLDKTALGPLLPAVISAVTLYPITAALNLSFNNGIHRTLANE